jgi:hypothetical protein
MRLATLLFSLFLLFQAAPAAAQGLAPHPQANPHAQQRAVDQNSPVADLPAGTIEATIVDAGGTPQAGIEVRLGIMVQSVAQGEARSQQTMKADGEGRVRFDKLSVASNTAYRVTVKFGGADYASSPFNLRTDVGQRVLIHVYPVSRKLDDSVRIGMRGFVFIAPRDDVFQFEVLFRVFNMGNVTWLPEDVTMDLPRDFKAFRANESMNDTKFEQVAGKGAKLTGTFTPGQHDVSFRFQVPKSASETASFEVGLPPRVAEIRVIAEASTSMGLEVDGFEPVQSDVTPQTGDRVLVTRKVLQDPSSTLGAFSVVLTGLPTPGPGRWIAVLISVLVAAAGALYAGGYLDKGPSSQAEKDDERRRARELILAELVELERLHERGQVGPRAFARSREQLLDAVARIGVPADEVRRKKAKRRAEKGEPEASTA